MNIAVINIRELIRYLCFFIFLVIVIVTGIIIIKNSSYSFCLNTQIPLMSKDEAPKKQKEENVLNGAYKILDTQLAMLSNLAEDEIIEEGIVEEEENNEIQGENIEKEEIQDKTIKGEESFETKVIEENNITASFTNTGSDVQVKNQSSYNVDELLANSSYEVTNKDKVVIYHTHTCESYTASEKYQYQMTGAYRTTDLNFTVAKVRRRIRRMSKTIWKNSSS